MQKWFLPLACGPVLVLLASAAPSLTAHGTASSPVHPPMSAPVPHDGSLSPTTTATRTAFEPAAFEPAAPILPEPVEPPPPPTPQEVLADGVLIVVSLPSQQMFVFEDGKPWDSSKVSTGKPGNDTPVGTFPILQKSVEYRSNLYDDASMPYMQRITWDGVALHAGRVPGYPASHGCIRLPKAFAKKLYGITGFASTLVIVTDEPVDTAEDAELLASTSA